VPALSAFKTPSSAIGSRAAGVLLAAVVAAVYLLDLARTPVYVGGDEAHFGVIGHALAETGRTLHGDRLPIFINLADPQGPAEDLPWRSTWYQPLLFYLVAAVLKILPLSEASVRLPTASVGGILNPLLMYVVARRLFGNRELAVLAAGLLALAPPHLILARQALDYILPLPFLLGAWWCVLAYIERPRSWLAFAAGLTLGVGCYSYIASWILMPIYLALMLVLFRQRSAEGRRGSALAALGFVLPLLAALPWLLTYPQMAQDTLERYRQGDGDAVHLIDASARGVGLHTLTTLVSIYWAYFDPSYLFLTGGPSLTTSTGRVGVFLLPVAVWLPCGLYALAQDRTSRSARLVLGVGLLSAPLPAVMRGEAGMVQRELVVLPFAALISVWGFRWLRESGRGVGWWLSMALLALLPLQFTVFAHDYWTHYKRRSAFYYDAVAFPLVVDRLLVEDRAGPAPLVYLSTDLDDVGAKWRFYLTAYNRLDLLARTRYVGEQGLGLDEAPAGSLLVMYVERARLSSLVQGGRWALVDVVRDVDQREAAAILRHR
jgi:4-amino-4-deoxy-L-arabinose transferase-like glycosyltransferase